MGSRIREHTKDKPKCMIKLNGKTILQRMIEIFKKCGIKNIVVVKGYKQELINYLNLKYYFNENFENNNNLASLFYAKEEMNDGFIVSFSDILFSEDVVRKLLENKSDISLVIDTNWIPRYKNRTLHPISEADKVTILNNKIIKIGKKVNLDQTHGEFIGLAKFSKKGAEILRTNYYASKKLYYNKSFHEATNFEKGHIMDITQEIINKGHNVCPVLIDRGWAEIDTLEDYENVQKLISERGSL